VLGDAIQITREASQLTVTSKVHISKRYLKVQTHACTQCGGRRQDAISGCSWMRSAATNDGRSGCRRRRAVTRQRMPAAFLRRSGRGCRHSGCTERQVRTVHSAAHVLDCTAHRQTDSGGRRSDSARAGLRAAFEGAMRMGLLFPSVAHVLELVLVADRWMRLHADALARPRCCCCDRCISFFCQYLTKKFLKKQLLRDYIRVIARTKNGYFLRYFNFHNSEDQEADE
jgi:hypothetical protein